MKDSINTSQQVQTSVIKRSKERRIFGILIAVPALLLVFAVTLLLSRLGVPVGEYEPDLSPPEIATENVIHFSEAFDSVGEDMWVYGKVDHIFTHTDGHHFINFCSDFRTCSFSAVIFADDTVHFSDVDSWGGRTLAVYGKILLHEERPQVVVSSPAQVREGYVDIISERDVMAGRGPLNRVVHVVDGDTIRVTQNGGTTLVRLIGIDAPETDGPYTTEECFGPEASEYLRELLEGREVVLVPGGSDRDQYDRLRRFVFLPDDTFVNALLVEEGYALAYAFESHAFEDMFFELETRARENELGLWGDACDE